MKKYILVILVFCAVWMNKGTAFPEDKEANGNRIQISKKDMEIIKIMEILNLMDLMENLDLIKDIEVLKEDQNNEKEK